MVGAGAQSQARRRAPANPRQRGSTPGAPWQVFPGLALASSYLRPHPEIKLAARCAAAALRKHAARPLPRSPPRSLPRRAGQDRGLESAPGLPARQVGARWPAGPPRTRTPFQGLCFFKVLPRARLDRGPGALRTSALALPSAGARWPWPAGEAPTRVHCAHRPAWAPGTLSQRPARGSSQPPGLQPVAESVRTLTVSVTTYFCLGLGRTGQGGSLVVCSSTPKRADR